jgi:hypothetical protein
LAVCDVRVTCGDDDVLVADASVTYAIPSSYDPASTLPTSSAP